MSLLHSAYTDSEVHVASCKMGTMVSFPREKLVGCDADHSSQSAATVKNVGAIPPLPTCLLIKHRDNFTFLPVRIKFHISFDSQHQIAVP
jgi:hypothetical protein